MRYRGHAAATRDPNGQTDSVLGQAAARLRDEDLAKTVAGCAGETVVQLRWLRTRMKAAALQALVVA